VAFKLDGYVEVKDRIPEFWLRYPDGRIISQPPVVVEIGGRTFVGVTTAVYADRVDSVPIAQASSWEPFPGSTNYTKDSEMENAETSAVGRALGALGIGIKNGFASADEVRNRQASPAQPEPATISAANAKRGVLDRLGNHPDVENVARSIWSKRIGDDRAITGAEWDALCDDVDKVRAATQDEAMAGESPG
jgi:hypothetical protein